LFWWPKIWLVGVDWDCDEEEEDDDEVDVDEIDEAEEDVCCLSLALARVPSV
jgi:hypothetical protein